MKLRRVGAGSLMDIGACTILIGSIASSESAVYFSFFPVEERSGLTSLLSRESPGPSSNYRNELWNLN